MKFGMLDIDWKYLGALLAREDDKAQSDFFKSFVKECTSWGTAYQVELQLAHVNGNLSDEEKDTLSMLSYKEEKPYI